MRTLGLDVGEKTIGVAVSDELGLTAQSLTTIRRSNLKDELRALRALVAEWNIHQVVVGLPLHMNGEEGQAAIGPRKLGGALQAATGLPVQYWDERLSTVAATRVLLEGDVSRKKRRQVIDQLAAAIILQGWLDSQRPVQADAEE